MSCRTLTALTALLAPLALAGCLSAPPPRGMPDSSVIGFNGTQAVPPDCEQLVERSHFVDAGFRRPGVAFGCATYTNLAGMLARPEDLVDSVPYGGADAGTAAQAVRRYEEDKVKEPAAAKVTTTTVGK
ncbi:hypothetical protein FAZ69_20585 [Trinickia terrae]|uniref:Lipoprotein n=1 Tax=Trinickia terrae TaxID=2571161 RepID=A0A4U1HZE4_9BURK|nr:CpaD family pilus assembly lipoprotein [Trinickia terrae]TKC86257.1 hypothetical protein FAZ69_20585 [Trinickia terrae]